MLFKVADDPQQQAAAGEVEAMVARARAGETEVLPRLRAYLDAHPEAWLQGGDLARRAMELWIGLIAGADLAAAESLARKAADLEEELAGPSASPLERLLVGRVVACWLQVHYADAAVAQGADLSLRQAAFAQRRQDSAHRRYLQAIGALAMVRRLMPAAAEPASLPPIEPTAGLSGEVGKEEGPGDGDAAGPGRPAPLVVFDPVAGPGPVDEPGPSTKQPVSSAS
jgi:hypothetical protein